MHVDSAIALINTLIYKPGWTFEAEDHTNRFEGSIKVKITYPAKDSVIANAPDYTKDIPGGARAAFPLVVRDCDDVDLYYQIAKVIMEIEAHEMREFLRVNPTKWAPFHPHQIDGMKRWANITEDAASFKADLDFGIV
jgi:hypothetical protein